MSVHPHQLYAVPFQEADQDRLAGFCCGTEHYADYLREWIQGSEVSDSLKRGTQVWLFENTVGQIVGYGSLGRTRWRWPLPDGKYDYLQILPALAVAEDFQGRPPDKDWRYSVQILSHLIAEAEFNYRASLETKKPLLAWLVLMVHNDNQRGIRFYQTIGFELIPHLERRHGHLVMKLWLGDEDIDEKN